MTNLDSPSDLILREAAATPNKHVLLVEGTGDVAFLTLMLDKPPLQDENIFLDWVITPAGGKDAVLRMLKERPGLNAMVDRDDDLKVGAKSTAILFGESDLVAQGVIYAGFFWAMWLVGARAELGLTYQVALGVALVVVLAQFVVARGRGREACFTAFRLNQWVGLALFAGIAAHYAL